MANQKFTDLPTAPTIVDDTVFAVAQGVGDGYESQQVNGNTISTYIGRNLNFIPVEVDTTSKTGTATTIRVGNFIVDAKPITNAGNTPAAIVPTNPQYMVISTLGFFAYPMIVYTLYVNAINFEFGDELTIEPVAAVNNTDRLQRELSIVKKDGGLAVITLSIAYVRGTSNGLIINFPYKITDVRSGVILTFNVNGSNTPSKASITTPQWTVATGSFKFVPNFINNGTYSQNPALFTCKVTDMSTGDPIQHHFTAATDYFGQTLNIKNNASLPNEACRVVLRQSFKGTFVVELTDQYSGLVANYVQTVDFTYAG